LGSFGARRRELDPARNCNPDPPRRRWVRSAPALRGATTGSRSRPPGRRPRSRWVRSAHWPLGSFGAGDGLAVGWLGSSRPRRATAARLSAGVERTQPTDHAVVAGTLGSFAASALGSFGARHEVPAVWFSDPDHDLSGCQRAAPRRARVHTDHRGQAQRPRRKTRVAWTTQPCVDGTLCTSSDALAISSGALRAAWRSPHA
jgi:hypothetical protein